MTVRASASISSRPRDPVTDDAHARRRKASASASLASLSATADASLASAASSLLLRTPAPGVVTSPAPRRGVMARVTLELEFWNESFGLRLVGELGPASREAD